jgi:hypothetical protein
VPGRYTVLGDVVWNGVGSGMGVLLHRILLRHVLAPHATSWRPPLVLATCLGMAALAAGWLLEPSPTRDAYWGQWTPDLGSMAPYEGLLLHASLNGDSFPRARFPAERDPYYELLVDWTFQARVLKGPPPRTLSPIASIYDGHQRAILIVGARGEDLVLRERTRARALRLDSPDLRWLHVLRGAAVGDTLRLEVRRHGADRCMAVNDSVKCGFAFTPGRTWGLLMYPLGSTARFLEDNDVAWPFVLFLGLGLLGRSLLQVAASGFLAGATIAAASAVTRLAVGPWTETLGAMAGLACGYGCARALRWIARTIENTRPAPQ